MSAKRKQGLKVIVLSNIKNILYYENVRFFRVPVEILKFYFSMDMHVPKEHITHY